MRTTARRRAPGSSSRGPVRNSDRPAPSLPSQFRFVGLRRGLAVHAQFLVGRVLVNAPGKGLQGFFVLPFLKIAFADIVVRVRDELAVTGALDDLVEGVHG